MLTSGCIFGCLYGLYCGLADLFISGWWHALIKGIVFGLFTGTGFGFLMALILLSVHYYCFHMAFDKNFPPISLETVKQTKTLIIEAELQNLWQHCQNALRAWKDVRIMEERRESNQICLKVTSTFKRYGEQIAITFHEMGDGKTKLVIQSQPVKKYTLVDYGKNYKNLLSVIRLIAAQLEPSVRIWDGQQEIAA